jgi:cytochrome c oxidase subunit 6a
MLHQRLGLRMASRFVRSPAFRSTAQRRLASTGGGQVENEFIRERQHIAEHAAATSGLWYKLSIYACIPLMLLVGANAYRLWSDHWEHWSHMPPLEERVEYPYQNIRTKKFPFGDGDKTLFWNSSVNYHNKDKAK